MAKYPGTDVDEIEFLAPGSASGVVDENNWAKRLNVALRTLGLSLLTKRQRFSDQGLKTSSYAMLPWHSVSFDTTAAAISQPLPLSPDNGDEVEILLAAGANALSLTYGGSTLETISTVGFGVTLRWSGTAWKVGSDRRSKTALDANYATYNQGRRVAVEHLTSVSGQAIPEGAVGVLVSLVGGGGGGGGGRRGAAGTVRCGGGGGGSAGVFEDFWIPAANLGTTYSVTIGAGGTGGSAGGANDTNGGKGGDGGTTTFTAGSYTFRVQGAVGGSGGSAADGVGGAPGSGGQPGTMGGSASTSGGIGGNPNANYSGASGPGGAGGGISAADAASNGGAGGGSFCFNQGNTQFAGGIVGGAGPASGAVGMPGWRGGGSGGGAASITGPAQAGGTATASVKGAGGGGGGASLNGNAAGAGGNGSPGWARVIFVYG
jgi:hypothetical protein